MEQDIIDKISLDFANPSEVVNILESMESLNRGPISDRLYRGIIFLSKGDMVKLNNFLDLAFTDYRDLLWQAEYEDPEERKYDFNKSFRELGLL